MKSNKFNNFKYTRLWKGLSVQSMANALDTSTATISAIENGHRQPTAEIRAKYAREFPIDDSFFTFIAAYEKTLDY
ncbi:helix-turn-helix transcriptional regulator [Indiicoccus explosivorum]|uniref:helix-turn-helix transcriptional regulator n=1 Tax=Indiicoccus explosivorum TaxID=1917864 RepID=UPI000B4425A8|nr:helix-turn-helix transcriptional regulator [Indiicoccus explosivorum]